MGPMRKFHRSPFGLHFLGRGNGQIARGHRQHFNVMDGFGMGFRMTSFTVDGAGVKPFHPGGLLGFQLFPVTVPAGLVISPGQGLDPFFSHRCGAGRGGPQVFMASGCGTALHLTDTIPFMMAVLAGIGEMQGVGNTTGDNWGSRSASGGAESVMVPVGSMSCSGSLSAWTR